MESFSLSDKDLERLKTHFRVEYPKRLKNKAVKIVNEVLDEGLNGNYQGTQKSVFVFQDFVVGNLFNKNKELLFYEYGTGINGEINPHDEPHSVEYNGIVYYKYNTYRETVGQESHPIFYNKILDMEKKLKELGG